LAEVGTGDILPCSTQAWCKIEIMIFSIKITDDQLVGKAFQDGMMELNEFWGVNWVTNLPDLFIVDTRNEIDQIKGVATSRDLVGWSKNRNIFLLNYRNLETESSYLLTPEQYSALIKHELNHSFFGIASGNANAPLWLSEGISIFLSGQTSNGQWKRPTDFEGFIDSEGENKRYAYAEGGFVVELLINKFGKEKIIQLVKHLMSIKDGQEFKGVFSEIYGIELDYKVINELYLK
jgi:hypothetical protein